MNRLQPFIKPFCKAFLRGCLWGGFAIFFQKYHEISLIQTILWITSLAFLYGMLKGPAKTLFKKLFKKIAA